MKIGIFDSGFGGLLITKSIVEHLPAYDYIYLGDNARAPYGDLSEDRIYEFTREGVEFLFKKECTLVILACNTASARALRRLQQEWLPQTYPDRRILGVIIPVAEYIASRPALQSSKIGLLATRATIRSGAYGRELEKRGVDGELLGIAAPLLVPLIEEGLEKTVPARQILKNYLRIFKKKQVSALVLGCTHYAILHHAIRRILGKKIRVIEPGVIVSASLAEYLERHPEINSLLSKNSTCDFFTTDCSEHVQKTAVKFWGNPLHLCEAKLE